MRSVCAVKQNTSWITWLYVSAYVILAWICWSGTDLYKQMIGSMYTRMFLWYYVVCMCESALSDKYTEHRNEDLGNTHCSLLVNAANIQDPWAGVRAPDTHLQEGRPQTTSTEGTDIHGVISKETAFDLEKSICDEPPTWADLSVVCVCVFLQTDNERAYNYISCVCFFFFVHIICGQISCSMEIMQYNVPRFISATQPVT